VIEADTIDQFWSTYSLSHRRRMSTLDEIAKEKQRVSEALARVDEQREKLTNQLGELDATERVLARYSKGRPARKTAARRRPRQQRRLLRRERRGARALRLQERLAASVARPASAIRCLPWQPERRSRKSPERAGVLARTMLAPRLPGTSGPAASKSATESSISRSRRGRSNAPRSNTR